MVSRQQILDQALALASQSGWESLTLRQIAAALEISMAEVYPHYAQKDDLVEAWFDRADQALLEQVPNPTWDALPPKERIERAVFCWLDALTEHRELTGQMLLYKLEPGHIHLQLGGLLRISRTVQWFREAAGLKASHLHRITQELVLSSLYLATFAYWLRDSSEGQHKSRELFRRKLDASGCLGLWY